MPLSKKQRVIHTGWREKTGGVEVAVEEVLADLPECRIISMQSQGYYLFLVVEFV